MFHSRLYQVFTLLHYFRAKKNKKNCGSKVAQPVSTRFYRRVWVLGGGGGGNSPVADFGLLLDDADDVLDDVDAGALAAQVGRVDAVDVDGAVDGVVEEAGVAGEPQVLQQVGRRRQHGHRIADVLAGDRLARVARARLEHGVLHPTESFTIVHTFPCRSSPVLTLKGVGALEATA